MSPKNRIHRIGTKGVVVYTDMIGKGSIVDTKAVQSLARKQGISDLGIGDIKNKANDMAILAQDALRRPGNIHHLYSLCNFCNGSHLSSRLVRVPLTFH
jgi:hypothetical protein